MGLTPAVSIQMRSTPVQPGATSPNSPRSQKTSTNRCSLLHHFHHRVPRSQNGNHWNLLSSAISVMVEPNQVSWRIGMRRLRRKERTKTKNKTRTRRMTKKKKNPNSRMAVVSNKKIIKINNKKMLKMASKRRRYQSWLIKPPHRINRWSPIRMRIRILGLTRL